MRMPSGRLHKKLGATSASTARERSEKSKERQTTRRAKALASFFNCVRLRNLSVQTYNITLLVPLYARPFGSIMPSRSWRDTGHKALCPVSVERLGTLPARSNTGALERAMRPRCSICGCDVAVLYRGDLHGHQAPTVT
eukprot:COSAG03_NODE_2926_length_2351_cov_1.928508_1_plen_139_part_00